MKCPFCGHEFEQGRVKCEGCPLQKNCKAVCCPNCGYELERDSKLADLFKRLVKSKSSGTGSNSSP